MTRQMLLLRLGSLRLSISYSFCLLITAALVLDSSGLVLLGLCAALCHETAHLAVMGLLGLFPEELRLTMLGGRLTRSYACRQVGYLAELSVSLAGGICNLVLAAVFYQSDGHRGILFSAVNLALGFFNLLPVQGLDGGRALESLCALRWEPQRSLGLRRGISAAVLLGLWLGAGYCLYRFTNPSLLLLAGYLTAIFLYGNG